MHLADSQAGSTAVGVVIWIFVIAVYWLPFIVGALERKHNLGVIAVWNFFAFFFLFPWIMAWVKVAEKPQQPTVVFTPPPYGWQPPQYPAPPGFQPPPAQPQPQAGLDRPQGYQ